MPCESPIRGYRPTTGGPILFNPPNTRKGAQTYKAIDIPCGKCILCQQEKARQWGVRITHEAQFWEENCFATLTYNEKNLPQYGSLNYEHLVKFWKRMRKNYGAMRYYAVGEYGDESLRPHYHACIFGHAFAADRKILRETPSLLWTSPQLEDAWGLGNVMVGALNFQTAQYTASYVLKKLTAGKQYVRVDEETGELIPLIQPRAFMSRNLGRQWWDQYGHHTTAHDYVVINGIKHKPPRAYDRWLGEVNQLKIEEIKNRRNKAVKPTTPEQNRARARNAHARAKHKSKKV